MPRVSAAVAGLLLTALGWTSVAGIVEPAPPEERPLAGERLAAHGLPAPLPASLPVAPGLNADFLDGLDAPAFARAGHDHDARYYTEAESDARFLGLGARAADSDRLDGLDSGQFLRRDAPWPGAYSTLQATGGRSLEFAFAAGSSCMNALGYTGLLQCVQPTLRPGRVDDAAQGHLPPGTEVRVGASYLLGSKGCCAADVGAHLVSGLVTIVKHPVNDSVHPAKLRLSYVDNGVLVREDWTTYADGELAFLEVAYTLHGDAPSSGACGGTCRVLDVVVRKDGGAAKAIPGLRAYATTALVDAFQGSQSAVNAHHLLAAAGRIAYP